MKKKCGDFPTGSTKIGDNSPLAGHEVCPHQPET